MNCLLLSQLSALSSTTHIPGMRYMRIYWPAVWIAWSPYQTVSRLSLDAYAAIKYLVPAAGSRIYVDTWKFVVVVVVLTLARRIKSLVTGQAPVTLELRNTPGKKTQTKGGTRIYHSWRNSCLHQKYVKVKSGVSLPCARSIPVHTSHYSRLENPTIPFATQDYHVYITRGIYHYAYARQTQVNWKNETIGTARAVATTETEGHARKPAGLRIELR